ncbi:MAG: SDR family NAD(P)-dependent oxidoreductase [Alphaproteobacteria bacterium]
MADKSYKTYHPQCVFITGATSGFGKAFARRFAAIGCSLILHGRSQEKLDSLAAEFSVPVCKILFDLRDKEATLNALQNIPSEFQNVDVLINNAGGALGLNKLHESNLEDLEAMIEMNNTSLVRITRHILQDMAERKHGHIINIGSIAGNWPYPGGHVYCAVKAFTKQLSLAIRGDLTGTNVRVTNIEPGIAETEFSIKRFKGDTQKAASVYANTVPLTAEDVAETVFWAATLPEHVNINTLEVMPTQQSFSALNIERN